MNSDILKSSMFYSKSYLARIKISYKRKPGYILLISKSISIHQPISLINLITTFSHFKNIEQYNWFIIPSILKIFIPSLTRRKNVRKVYYFKEINLKVLLYFSESSKRQ